MFESIFREWVNVFVIYHVSTTTSLICMTISTYSIAKAKKENYNNHIHEIGKKQLRVLHHIHSSHQSSI